LTCMSVKSVTIKSEREGVVRLVFRDVVSYLPGVVAAKRGKDQKLQESGSAEMALDIGSGETIQINGQIFSGDSLARKYKTIPDSKKQGL
jgi:hypothetical protein